MIKSIEWVDGKVMMLDQSKLPFEVTYIVCTDYLMVADGIRKLRIRGAPAIGIAAAMGIALAAQDIHSTTSEQFMKAIEPVFYEMLSTRPTAVNISWAVERMKKLIKSKKDES
ncbi:MAG: mtnA, partial [Nitrospirae bacterium]|nr:mtnA [Nitrospirota bacterium]